MVTAAEARRGKGHKKSKPERPKHVAEPVAVTVEPVAVVVTVEPVAPESSDGKPVEVDHKTRSEDGKSGKEQGNGHGSDKGHDKKDKKGE